MDWVYPKRRGPEWKQGWTSNTISSISTPPFQLLAIFTIVIALLWFSQYTDLKAQWQHNAINFQLLLFLLPILLIFFITSFSTSGWLSFRASCADRQPVRHAGGFPWGVAMLLVFILVLLSYQSSFQSKWFAY